MLLKACARDLDDALTMLLPGPDLDRLQRCADAVGCELPRLLAQLERLRQEVATAERHLAAAEACRDARAEQVHADHAVAQRAMLQAQARLEAHELRLVAASRRHGAEVQARRAGCDALAQAREQLPRVTAELDQFDAAALEDLRARGWKTAAYAPRRGLSRTFWADRATARRLKAAAGCRTFAELVAWHAERTATQAQHRPTCAHFSTNDARLAAAIDRAAADHRALTAGLAPLQQSRDAAEVALQPHDAAMQVQRRLAAEATARASELATLRAEEAALLQSARSTLRAHLCNSSRREWNAGLSRHPDLAALFMRVDRCQQAAGHLEDLARRCEAIGARLRQTEAHARRERALWMRPKKSSAYMTHKALLWRLGHWDWERENAELDACRRAARALMITHPHLELWAVDHAAERWNWWWVLTHGAFDRILRPSEWQARRAGQASFQYVDSPLTRKARGRAMAATARRWHGGGLPRLGHTPHATTDPWAANQQDALLLWALADADAKAQLASDQAFLQQQNNDALAFAGGWSAEAAAAGVADAGWPAGDPSRMY